MVLPDNVLFEGNTGRQIRADLMDKCNLHTILRLPTGIFYAQGVKTNVLFFTRGETDKGNTREVWVYDLRANMPQFGKRTVLTREHFAEFEAAFGDDPLGSAKSLAAQGHRRGGPLPPLHPRLDRRAWRQPRHRWLKDESEAAPTSCPSRPRSRRRRWTNSKERWRNCAGFWRSWARRWRRERLPSEHGPRRVWRTSGLQSGSTAAPDEVLTRRRCGVRCDDDPDSIVGRRRSTSAAITVVQDGELRRSTTASMMFATTRVWQAASM